MKNKILISSATVLGLATSAHAAESCRDAKDMIRMVNTFYAADEDRINVIAPSVSMQFEGLNGHDAPDQLLYRHEDQNIYLDINEEGLLQSIETLVGVSKKGQLCSVVDGEVAEDAEGASTTSVSVGFVFPYRRSDGQFAISELVEGAKDGSKIMKGVAPGGLGFVVPGLKTIVLKSNEDGAPIPDFSFARKGKSVEVPGALYDGSFFIRMKDIKSAKADKLSIDGDYTLTAMFKVDLDELAEAEAKRLAEASEE